MSGELGQKSNQEEWGGVGWGGGRERLPGLTSYSVGSGGGWGFGGVRSWGLGLRASGPWRMVWQIRVWMLDAGGWALGRRSKSSGEGGLRRHTLSPFSI